MDHYYSRANEQEECWEVLERAGISDDGEPEDALIARFYDGGSALSPLAVGFAAMMNAAREWQNS